MLVAVKAGLDSDLEWETDTWRWGALRAAICRERTQHVWPDESEALPGVSLKSSPMLLVS